MNIIQKPLFSILIPAYKDQFLGMAISSVLNQTYKNLELIIVDDCSPNDLKSIVAGFDDSRIQFYRNERNYGAIDVVDNWNKCLEYATGDYVICMGDDDMLCANCLEVYAKLISANPENQVFHGRTEIIDEKGNTVFFLESRDVLESIFDHLLYRWEGRRQYIGDFVFKTEPLRCYGGFYKLPLAWASDDISVIRQAFTHGIANTNEFVFKYRENSQTISTSGSAKIKFDAICKEHMWYKEFLVDGKFVKERELKSYNLVLKRLEPHFLKKKLEIIADDISNSYFNFWGWLYYANKHDLSYKMIIYALIIAFVNKQKDKYKLKR